MRRGAQAGGLLDGGATSVLGGIEHLQVLRRLLPLRLQLRARLGERHLERRPVARYPIGVSLKHREPRRRRAARSCRRRRRTTDVDRLRRRAAAIAIALAASGHAPVAATIGTVAVGGARARERALHLCVGGDGALELAGGGGELLPRARELLAPRRRLLARLSLVGEDGLISGRGASALLVAASSRTCSSRALAASSAALASSEAAACARAMRSSASSASMRSALSESWPCSRCASASCCTISALNEAIAGSGSPSSALRSPTPIASIAATCPPAGAQAAHDAPPPPPASARAPPAAAEEEDAAAAAAESVAGCSVAAPTGEAYARSTALCTSSRRASSRAGGGAS